MPDSDISETIFRWGRIQENSDWLLPLTVFVLLLVYCIRRYNIDAGRLKLWQRSLLLSLRITVIAALLLYYLHPQWENLVASSRIVLLVDTSASMANRDTNDGQTRLDAALDWLGQSRLVSKLAEKHDVSQFAFSETLHDIFYASITPDGNATALGDALFDVLQRERGQPLAGIILISDGGHNAGRSIDSPLETAQRLRIPIYPIGIGQTHPPLNYRIGVIDLPSRVVPNDPFIVKVPIERVGGDQNTEIQEHPVVTAELLLDDTLIESREIAFESDGTIETSFNVRLPDPGTYRLTALVIPPQDDAIPEDNRQQIEVHAVDRKDRILLFASTPSRDYQFICAQLFRDKTAEVDVYLSWAQSGISQNADRILDRFPSSRSEMAEYDVVIAFDPDWRELSPEQIDLLEFWVARQGGGLMLVAGQIHQADSITGWVTDPGMDKIRALYPVEFLARTASFDHRFRNSPTAYPLRFSRAGEAAEFLQITDEQGTVMDFWSLFPGYFGYFPVRGVKPAATLLVSSGSPDAVSNEWGALVVEQFYGAGRVIYFGSGELWRLRRIDDRVFEQIVTKTVRYAGQGRLQRESDRGILATDRPRYSIGSTAQLRMTASDAQLNPLTLPALPVEVLSPAGTLRMLDAVLNPDIPGTYLAYIPLDIEGTWTIQWQIPDSEQQIVRTIQVQMSDLEREHPNRNEPLLREIAERSGGVYFSDFGLAESLPERIGVRSQRAVVDEVVQEKLLYYLLLTICVVLLLEWTLRRLMQLA